MNINRENYSEFIKDERELEFVLMLDEESTRVDQVLYTLKKYLEIKKSIGDILNYSIQENRLEIDAPRYTIFALVLHTGDVCQYTINKKNKTKANYSRRMIFESVLDTIDKYLR
ncbi:hypothetical protein ACIQYS_01595 [Psychrobacillus sp. NPDC096426]|uniref:hypothetical protein n=1 Tax=Psychrobacillus sp. NPDC096426 TaxID=3364491 RepID=UPI003802F594